MVSVVIYMVQLSEMAKDCQLLLSDLICLFFAYGEISDIFTTFLTSPGQMTGVFHIDCTLVDRIYLNQHQ